MHVTPEITVCEKIVAMNCLIAAVALYMMNGLGITAGAHRLWSHRSYHAKLPLRILLAIFNSIAFQVKSLSLQVLIRLTSQ